MHRCTAKRVTGQARGEHRRRAGDSTASHQRNKDMSKKNSRSFVAGGSGVSPETPETPETNFAKYFLLTDMFWRRDRELQMSQPGEGGVIAGKGGARSGVT